MRRLRRPPSVFSVRGSAWTRGTLMLGMLVILGMMISQAGRPGVWRWLVKPEGQQPPMAKLPDAAAERVAKGPTDLDPAEKAAAKEDFAGVRDRIVDSDFSIPARELFAYWRLYRWAERQSTADLARRAEPVSMRQLWSEPERFRGRPVRVKLYVKQAITYEDTPPGTMQTRRWLAAWAGALTPPGVSVAAAVYEKALAAAVPAHPATFYEVRGYSPEPGNGAILYYLIAPELPTGFPVGDGVTETVIAYGHFYKMHTYKDGQEKPRTAALLFGRVAWQQAPPPERASPEALLVGAGVGGVFLLALLARWYVRTGRRLLQPRHELSPRPIDDEDHGARQTLDWLERPPAQFADAPPAEPDDLQGGDRKRERLLAELS